MRNFYDFNIAEFSPLLTLPPSAEVISEKNIFSTAMTGFEIPLTQQATNAAKPAAALEAEDRGDVQYAVQVIGRAVSGLGDLNLNSVSLLDSDGDATSTWGASDDNFDIGTTADAANLNALLIDDTLAAGSNGIVPTGDTAPFLGISDTVNADNTTSGTATATFSFDISSVTSGLSLSMDWAAFGDFETVNDFFTVTASIDGAPTVTLFTLLPDELGAQTYSFADSSTVILNDPMELTVSGGATTTLSNVFQTFTTAIAGTGSNLVITITGQADGAGDVLAMRNLIVEGDTGDAPAIANIEVADGEYLECSSGDFAITSALTLSDADSANLSGATIEISAGFDAANDSLIFTTQNGISGVFAGGILTLSGPASVADYQAAIRSVTFTNDFTTESTATRTISITVTDGVNASNTQSRDITMTIDETANGTAGADLLACGFGADTLNGLAGNDRLFGQDGDDILNGGDGSDQLWGMAGADTMDGGAGTDSVFYLNAASAIELATDTGGTVGDAAGDTYTNVERFYGSNFDDVMTGDGTSDFLAGLSGNDTLTGNAGNDILLGGLGDDTVTGGDGDDVLSAGDGTDNLTAGAGNDVVRGDAGTNTIDGGAGNDRIYSGTGADNIEGGADEDTIAYTGSASGVTLNLLTSTASGGSAAGDTFSNIENVIGSLFGDNITGDAGDNLIIGMTGNDILFGGDGLDRLLGGDGDDALYGGEGNDILSASSGTNTLVGNAGNDRIIGGSGVDDILGETGNDTLTGGLGADQFIFQAMAGSDRITDFEDGVDIIRFGNNTGLTNFGDLTLTQVASHVQISSSAGTILVLFSDLADWDASDFIFDPLAEVIDDGAFA